MCPGMYLSKGGGAKLSAIAACISREKQSKKVRNTHPSSVRAMLMRTSAPQPATSTTPTGGTVSC